MNRRVLFVHVGCRKSGTSVLQTALRDSREDLLEQGLQVPFRGRERHLAWIQAPLVRIEAGKLEAGRRGLQRLAARLEDEPGDRLLITLEDLAEVTQPGIDEFMAALARSFDVHVVVTARDWSRQIPSEWQQGVKSRLTTPYPDYLEAVVRGSAPDGERFLLRQHLPGIAARWGRGLDPGHVHVLAVPSGRDPLALFRVFGGLVGVDPESFKVGRTTTNTSLGHEQAELLRQVNVALGDRLAEVRTQYRPAVRHLIINGALRKQRGTRPTVPVEYHDWCRDQSRTMLQELRAAGHDLLGNPEDLLVDFDGRDDVQPNLAPEHMHELAVKALADAANANYRQNVTSRRATKAPRATKASSPPRPAQRPPRRSRPVRAARTIARRARDLIGTKGSRP